MAILSVQLNIMMEISRYEQTDMEHELVFPSSLGIPYIVYTSLCHTDSTLLTYLLHQLKTSTLKPSTVGVKGERLHMFRLYTAQSKCIFG